MNSDESTQKKGLGARPENRSLERAIRYGIIVINKPDGPTSHQVSEYAQKILGIDKAGHSGTLDPGVTGVLPIALGDATKIAQLTLKSDKEYVGVLFLHKDVPLNLLNDAIKKFTGRILQVPPVRSAVKRVERPRMVYEFSILEKKGQDVLVRVRCEAGTYIRKLFHDLGQYLGCGAHMGQLIRTKAAGCTDKEMVSLQDLADAVAEWKEGNGEKLQRMIHPVERIVEGVPSITIVDGAVRGIIQGQVVKRAGVASWKDFSRGEMIVLKTLKGELVCVATSCVDSGKLKLMSDGVVAKSERVYYREEWLRNVS